MPLSQAIQSLRLPPALAFLVMSTSTAVTAAVMPGDDLQAILDRGDDLILEPNHVYPIAKALRFKSDGQKIRTRDAKGISTYAVLAISDKENPQLINGSGMDDILIEHLILDGKRYQLSSIPKVHPRKSDELVHLGGPGAHDQTIKNCVLLSARTWSTLKLHEGATGLIAKNNIIIGAGAGPRGNGRDLGEQAFSWGDGISCAATGSLVENNLILDATDVGIVAFGAPGTIIRGNTIATISRECLGGINLVDALDIYAIEGAENHFSYQGTTVEDNLIDAHGGRIHIAIPIGTAPWGPRGIGKSIVGGSVRRNHLTGGAGGYGYVAYGLEDFEVTGNTSDALFSGPGDGQHKSTPADPGAFLVDTSTIESSELQDDFIAADGKLVHLLRCNHGPLDASGYRVYPYGDHEVAAVVAAAFTEMLARSPHAEELVHWSHHLGETKMTSDTLRRFLMLTPEFIELHGAINPNLLQDFRIKLWMDLFEKATDQNPLSRTPSRTVYQKAKSLLTKRELRLSTAPKP